MSAPTQARPNRSGATSLRALRRSLPWLGAVLLVGAIVAGLWPQPTPVEVAEATRGPLRASVNEEGRTRIRHRYLVAAPVTGQLRRIELKAGAEVITGQTVVAVIDPLAPTLLDARSRSLAEARRDAAAARVAKAQAAQGFAASELRRFTRLHNEGTISSQELESAQLRETAAARDLVAAESALREVEAELAEFVGPVADAGPGTRRPPVEVRAPASGRVLRVVEESARVIPAGAPLLEIGDPTDLEVVIEVLSRDGAAILPGTLVELDHWGGDKLLLAKVRLVEPAAFTKVSALGVEEQRVNVIADLLSPPADRPSLGDQFRVEARIITWQGDRVLKVPAGALFRQANGWAAFVVARGHATVRPVRIGRSNGLETEILEGLNEGDQVILYPGDRVRQGGRVRLIQIAERDPAAETP